MRHIKRFICLIPLLAGCSDVCNLPALKTDAQNGLQAAARFTARAADSTDKAIAAQKVSDAKPTAKTCTVTTTRLNVRVGPGVEFPISGVPLKKGDRVPKLDQSDGWIQSKAGWLAAQYCQ
jgi:uncharacterized protein YraI